MRWDIFGKEEAAGKTEIKVKWKNLCGKVRQRKSKPQLNPGEIALIFFTLLQRTLIDHSAYPEVLAGKVLRRNRQPHLQAWKSNCVKGSQIASQRL